MSLGGMIETPDDIHHRRLSRSGRTHDGHELAPMDFQRNASKCVNFHVTHVVNLVNAIKADQGIPLLAEEGARREAREGEAPREAAPSEAKGQTGWSDRSHVSPSFY